MIWLRIHTRTAVLLLWMSVVSLPLVHVLAEDAPIGTSPQELREQITELRCQTKYTEAVSFAEELVRFHESHQPATEDGEWWETEDARCLLEELRRISGWPEEKQSELAEVDRATEEIGVLLNQGKYDDAIAKTEAQLAARRRLLGDGSVDVTISMDMLAGIYYVLGDLDRTEQLFREALVIRERQVGRDHPDMGTAMGNLATILSRRGEWARAEPMFREAIAIERNLLGEDNPNTVGTMSGLAELLVRKGDLSAGEAMFREVLALDRKQLGDKHPYVATSLHNLAMVLAEEGNYDEAEELYRESLVIRRELYGGDHPSIASSLSGLSSVLADKENMAEAAELCREALEMRQRFFGNEHPMVAASMNNLARFAEMGGDRAEGEALYREALAIRRQCYGDTHPDVVHSLSNLARLLVRKGDYEGAERSLVEAAAVHEVARLRAGSGLERSTFQKSPYLDLAVTRLAMGKQEEAWPAVEKALSRSLFDLLFTTEQRELNSSESAREDSLAGVMADLERELASYRRAARRDTTGEVAGRIEECRTRLLLAEAEWGRFRQEIARKYPVTEGQVFSLERIQGSLAQSTAIVGWVDVGLRTGEYHSWGYVIRKAGPVFWARLPYTGSDPDEDNPYRRAKTYRHSLARSSSPEAGLTRDAMSLWGERIEPLEGVLNGVEDLVVISYGALLGIPVEFLKDGRGVYLGDQYAVSYTPSGTIYAWLGDRASQVRGWEGNTLLVGDPPFTGAHLAAMKWEGEGETLVSGAEPHPEVETLRNALAGDTDAMAELPRLQGSREEILTVAAIAPGPTVLVGLDASEQELVRLAEVDALRSFSIIHLATHALVDDERPERSALVMSQVSLPDRLETALGGARIYDGLITAEEVIREWNLDADLVTLSACETGLGKEVSGEGYVGFAHAFMRAGGRSLLVSLWKVDDEATALLMQRFYENLYGKYQDERKGRTSVPMSKAGALQEAKRWLREYTDRFGRRPYRHPYYWSAFILIGDRG